MQSSDRKVSVSSGNPFLVILLFLWLFSSGIFLKFSLFWSFYSSLFLFKMHSRYLNSIICSYEIWVVFYLNMMSSLQLQHFTRSSHEKQFLLFFRSWLNFLQLLRQWIGTCSANLDFLRLLYWVKQLPAFFVHHLPFWYWFSCLPFHDERQTRSPFMSIFSYFFFYYYIK